MKLRTKSILTVAALSLLVFIAIQAIMFLVLEPTFISQDNDLCRRQANHVKDVIDYRISTLAVNTKAYAIWDETYRFAQYRNQDYIENNYDDLAFEYLRLNLLTIVDNRSEIIYCQSFDLNSTSKVQTPQEIKSFLNTPDIWRFDTLNDTNSGLVEVDGTPMMFVTAPIVTSEGEGPMVGGIMFGRYLDGQEIWRLSTLTELNFTVTPIVNFKDPNTIFSLVSDSSSAIVKVNDEYTATVYTLLNDFSSEPAFIVEVNVPRVAYQNSLYFRNIFLALALGIAAAFGLVMGVLLDRNLVKPLTKMAGYVEEVSLNPNFSPPALNSAEELTVLTDAVKNTVNRKLEGMNEVSVMVAHDLRNPLAGIRNSAYLLKKHYGTALDAEGNAILARIDDSVRYADNIVQNLLEYSSEIKLDKVPSTAKQLVNQTLSKLAIPKNIEVINRASGGNPVMVDPCKIERVFTNLITNSLDAMPEGGTLQIDSKKLKGGYVRLDFCDSGVGFSEKAIANLWVPFFTTKAKGMGIGLSICKRIVDAHGGKIEVESKVGKGTCFSVYLPTE